MVDFNMERKRQTRLAVEVPPMPDPIPRVTIKIEAKGEGAHFTIGGFANWIIGDQVRSKSIQKLEARGTKAKDFIFKLEGVEISDEKDTIFATAFKILKSFPRSITFELCTPEFGAGRYAMLLRANMRTQVDVQSQKVATLEKEDVVHVVQTEEDPNTGAIRGLVRFDTPYVGERVLYEAKSIKKRVSARVIALSPLTLQVVRSSRLPPEVSDSTISEASPALLTHPTGWISLKSSSGQVCVRKAMF